MTSTPSSPPSSSTSTSSTKGKTSNQEQQRYLIQVSESLPSLQQCHDFVSDPSCGAISSFIGTTRDNFHGKTVSKLSYEGYVPMAIKELTRTCDEATARFPSIVRIAAVHVLGDCPVGAPSVMLCASSPHRKDAMHCVEFLIDELKARVPIWKLEVYEGDEGSVWKENVEWLDGKPKRVMVKQETK